PAERKHYRNFRNSPRHATFSAAVWPLIARAEQRPPERPDAIFVSLDALFKQPACAETARILPCQRAAAISAPGNRAGPDGSPVVEPPLGSRLTASAALASASAVSCGRTRPVVVPLR